MNRILNPCILLVVLIMLLTACKKEKEKCGTCDCETTVAEVARLAPVTDSAAAIAAVKGSWQLKCSRFNDKYGHTSHTSYDKGDRIKVYFTDTTYTFYTNDSLQFTYPFFVDGSANFRSNNQSFYLGNLGASTVKLRNDELGINTVFPFTGSYYLVFKRP